MKVKSNYVKSLLIALGIAWLFTGFNTNAFFINNSYCNNNYFPDCSSDTARLITRFHDVSNNLGNDFTTYNTYNYYFRDSGQYAGAYYTISTGEYVVSSGNLKGYNDGDYQSFGAYSTNSYSYAPKATYSFVKVVPNFSNFALSVYSVWEDKSKTYFNYTLSNLPDISVGAFTDSWQYYALWHGSIVFYNAGFRDYMKTYQLIGDQQLDKYVIYVDTISTNQNVWLIDYANKVAWSQTITGVNDLSSWLFGRRDLSPNAIDQSSWELKYNIVYNTGGDYFFPQTLGNKLCNASSTNNNNRNSSAGCQSSSRFNAGFTFTNTIFTAPHYGNGNSGNNGSGDQITIDYLKCVDTYTSIGNMAKLISSCNNSCNSQGNDNSCGDYFFYMNNYTGTGSYTGSIDSVSCRDMLNYANSFYVASNSDLEIYHDRLTSAFNYADRGVDIDPVSICSAYASEDQKYEMLNFFEKIQYQFSSGYNYFNVPSCSDNYMGKSYAWGNYLLIFVAGRILFILFSVF